MSSRAASDPENGRLVGFHVVWFPLETTLQQGNRDILRNSRDGSRVESLEEMTLKSGQGSMHHKVVAGFNGISQFTDPPRPSLAPF